MQYFFALAQVALIFAQVLLLRRHRQGRTIFILLFTILISIPSFVPTTPSNNIRIDLVLTDFALTPLVAMLTLMIWVAQRRAGQDPEA